MNKGSYKGKYMNKSIVIKEKQGRNQELPSVCSSKKRKIFRFKALFSAWIWCLINRTKIHWFLPQIGRIQVNEGRFRLLLIIFSSLLFKINQTKDYVSWGTRSEIRLIIDIVVSKLDEGNGVRAVASFEGRRQRRRRPLLSFLRKPNVRDD